MLLFSCCLRKGLQATLSSKQISSNKLLCEQWYYSDGRFFVAKRGDGQELDVRMSTVAWVIRVHALNAQVLDGRT